MKKWMTIGAMALAVAAADAVPTRAQDFVDENGDGIDDASAHVHRFGRRGFLRGVRSQLTDEQRAEIKTALEDLKASEASRDEVRAALQSMLEGYGVEHPDQGDRVVERLSGVLTADQLAEVQAKVDELNAADASHADVRAAVGELLTGYGVEFPGRPDRLSSVLAADQLASLRSEIDALRESGASRADIHAAFEEKLTELGVDPSQIKPGKRSRGGFGKFRGRRGGFRGPAPAPADGAADAN